jgi:pimeloyl-ACP methyl ester carboxylesterase
MDRPCCFYMDSRMTLWHVDDATFARSAAAFDNPDDVDVVIHSYRHRLGLAAGYPPYEELEQRLAAQPTITVPTITLDGDADGVVLATDGTSTAAKFAGERQHRVIPNVSHNLPQEDPTAFAAAVWKLASKTR